MPVRASQSVSKEAGPHSETPSAIGKRMLLSSVGWNLGHFLERNTQGKYGLVIQAHRLKEWVYYPSDATLEMQNMTKPGSTLAAGFNPRCSLRCLWHHVKTSASNAGVWESAFSRSEFFSRIQRCGGRAVTSRPRAWSGVQAQSAATKDATSSAYFCCASVVSPPASQSWTQGGREAGEDLAPTWIALWCHNFSLAASVMRQQIGWLKVFYYRWWGFACGFDGSRTLWKVPTTVSQREFL